MIYVFIFAVGFLLVGSLYGVLLMVGLQEADDPGESLASDLTEFEKHHVDRPDVPPDA